MPPGDLADYICVAEKNVTIKITYMGPLKGFFLYLLITRLHHFAGKRKKQDLNREQKKFSFLGVFSGFFCALLILLSSSAGVQSEKSGREKERSGL